MTEIGDHRWEGMSNDQLAGVIRKMRDGKGAGQLGDAVDMLKKAADGMTAIDDTLRQQLGTLGIAWNSKEASTLGHGATAQAAEYAEMSNTKVSESGSSVDGYGNDYGRAKNGMPEPEKLTPKFDTSLGGMAKNGFQTLTGHTPDYVQQARAANEARQRAVDGMNGYTGASQEGLAGYQPLPPVPTTNINATPVQSVDNYGSPAPGGMSTSSYHGPSGGGSGGGGSNTPLYPVAGPNYVGGPNAPGSPGNPPAPGAPERFSGSGSSGSFDGQQNTPGGQQATPTAPHNNRLFDTAATAAGIAGTAGGIAGAAGREERVIPRNAAALNEKTPSEPRQGAKSLAGAIPEEEAAARTAGRLGGTKGKPGTSMMQPATGRGKRDKDRDHVRKYPVESDDVFNDVEAVAPPVIGAHEEEQ